MDNIFLEAQGEFPFKFFIEKAQAVEEAGQLFVQGVASTLNVDHDNERMAKGALISMANVINETTVPLRIEHQKTDEAIVGTVFKAWVDERNQLWVKASLDPNHPAGPLLHKSLKEGVKLGLSVGGLVKKAVRELVESTGRAVKTFYDVQLSEVSVTQRPANYDAWLFAKSITNKKEDVEGLYETPFYQEFLFDNLQLDYAYQFAKSIPDKAWHKVEKEIKNNTNMNKDEIKKTADETKEETKKTADENKEETTKASEDTKEETEKSVSRGEFNTLKSMIEKGFNSVAEVMSTKFGKGMASEAKDQENPDKNKENHEVAAKSSDGALDQENPDEKKDTKKAMDDDKDETKKTSDKEKGETPDDEYKMKSIEGAIKKMQDIAKGSEDKEETKEKAMDDDKEETTKSQKAHPLDQFVASITDAMESMNERVEKSGKRIPGLPQAIADIIKGDAEIQASIRGMVNEPGFKKSVTLGVPYMTTKDGKRYQLTASSIEKSEKKAVTGSFKDLYKSDFSSVSAEQEN